MKPNFAIVVDVNSKGVKLRIEGEQQPRETYCHGGATVNTGDRVFLQWIGEDPFIVCKFLY